MARKDSLPTNGTKRCSKCKEYKSVGDFYVRPDRACGLYSQCKRCSGDKVRKYLSSDTGRRTARNAALLRNYGITLDEYESLLQSQDNACAVCRLSFEDVQPDLDHCHSSNRVRGVLCHNCNVAIGLLKDSPDICLAASKYLLTFQCSSEVPTFN